MANEPLGILITSASAEESAFLSAMLSRAKGRYDVHVQTFSDAAALDADVVLCYSGDDAGVADCLKYFSEGEDVVPLVLVCADSTGYDELANLPGLAAPPLFASELTTDLLERTIRFAASNNRENPGGAGDSKYRVIVEHSVDIIHIVAREGRISYASPSTTRILHYEPGELLGHALVEYVHEADVEAVEGLLSRVSEAPELIESHTFRFRNKEGDWRILECRGTSLLHEPAVDGILLHSRDVTERVRAEEALRASEMRNRALLDALPDAMVRMSRDGEYLEYTGSREYRPVSDPSQIIGKRVHDILPQELADKALDSIHRALRLGETQLFEYEVNVDGEVRHREARVVRCGEDEVLSIMRDITARRRAENELRRSENRFRRLIENSLDIITVIDEQGKIKFASPSVRLVLGYESGEMEGQSVFDYIHAGDLTGIRRLFVEGANVDGFVASTQFRIRHADGSWRLMEAKARNLLHDPQLRGIVVNGRDISERKLAERQLKRSEDLLGAVINSAPILLFAVDREGRFTLAEGRGLEAMDASTGDVIGRSIFDVYRDSPSLLYDVRQALRGDAFRSIAQINQSVFECWFSPLRNEDDEIEGVLGVATDISDLKHSEDQLRRSKTQLRELARHIQSVREEERTRIAREIHDVLGQAMTVMKMDVTWLANRIGKADELASEKIRAMSDLIVSTIQTIRKIATELRPGILDDLGLSAAIEWQAHEFETRTGIRCDASNIDPSLEVDRDRATSLFRIFQEILTNVARHANADRIDISLRGSGSSILMQVRDNGRGIAEDELTNTKSLGLLGMRERALAWGGTVKFKGEKGHGTTVSVQFPTELTEEREALQ